MRSSAPEGPIAPRAKQATPSASSGTTACPAGGQPISQISRAPSATTTASSKNSQSPPHKKSSAPHSSPNVSKESSSSRNATHKGQPKQPTTFQGYQSGKEASTTSNSDQSKPTHSSQPSKVAKVGGSNSHQATSSKGRSKSPPTPSGKHASGNPPSTKSTGSKHAPGSAIPQNQENFGEYDDQEWDVGVGHLIIDLDADIAQADRGKMSSSSSSNMNSSIEDKASLKMKIKRTKPSTKTSEAKHVIVKSESTSVGSSNPLNQGGVVSPSPVTAQHNGSIARTSGESSNSNRTPTTPKNIYKKEKRRPEVNGAVNPSASSSTPSRPSAITNGPGSPAKESRPDTSNGAVVKKEYPKVSPATPKSPPHSPLAHSPSRNPQIQNNPSHSCDKSDQSEADASQGPSKRIKLGEEKVDSCVGTSVGTITEPDSLGPCEPGTGVTLEGIVWHETEGGVLVVNVTWRGKSYVGTLLDCTKHDWAPPRLCDSPTSDFDARTAKGRGKRGRTAASTASGAASSILPEVNVAETRSGKLRNAAKGRRGGVTSGMQRSATLTTNPPASPDKPDLNNCLKRKSAKDDCDPNKNAKRSRFSSARSTPTNNSEQSSSPGPEQQNSTSENDSESLVVGQHRAPSPKFIECPEPNCGKKYTHINGLKYHQTHAHKEPASSEEGDTKERKRAKTSTPNSPQSVIENGVNLGNANATSTSKTPVVRTTADKSSSDSAATTSTTSKSVTIVGSKENGIAAIPIPRDKLEKVLSSDQVSNKELNKAKLGVTLTPTNERDPPKQSSGVSENPPKSHTPSPSPTHPPPVAPATELTPIKASHIPAAPLHAHHAVPTTPSPVTHVPTTPVILSPALALVNEELSTKLPSDGKLDKLATTTTIYQTAIDLASAPSTPIRVPARDVSPAKMNVSAAESTKPTAPPSVAIKVEVKREELNGVCLKEEQDSSVREETRSPAYSDISEANDTAPSIEDLDSKDFKDDKKLESSLASPSQYAYGLYYNNYNQPPHQYMMQPMQQQPSSPSMVKAEGVVDPKEKESKDMAAQGNSEYMKIPPHYLYHYAQLYPSAYANPSPYVRENVYSDDDKPKAELKDSVVEEADKGPTDLSRSSNNAGSSRATVAPVDKSPGLLLKDIKCESPAFKEMETKLGLLAEKRHSSEINYRYSGPYDNRGSRLPSPHVPLPSPLHRPGTVSPATSIKEEKCDKRPEGVKPTMETTGPPPAPTSSAYYPPFPYSHVGFDPYRASMMPSIGLPHGFPPYGMAGHTPLGGMRYPMVAPSGPEDLSRSNVPPNFFGGGSGGSGGGSNISLKMGDIQERIHKSSSSQLQGLPCSMAKSSSPMAYASSADAARIHHAQALLSTSSPSLPISSNIPITTMSPLHHHVAAAAAAERKLLPHLGLPDGYPYNMLPGAQFSPHYPALGLNPAGLGLPPVMTMSQQPK